MPQRLTTPLVSAGGELRPASWDEAIGLVAEQLRTHRGRRFGMFSCSKATNETNYMAQKFVRTVMGSNNIDSCNRT